MKLNGFSHLCLQVAPITIHPAHEKAAHYFGFRVAHVPVGNDFLPNVSDIENVGMTLDNPNRVFPAFFYNQMFVLHKFPLDWFIRVDLLKTMISKYIKRNCKLHVVFRYKNITWLGPVDAERLRLR